MNPTIDSRSLNRSQPRLDFYVIPDDSDSEYPEEDEEDEEDEEEESGSETEDDEDEALEDSVYWEREGEQKERLRLMRRPRFEKTRACLMMGAILLWLGCVLKAALFSNA
jgi:hypothetical protein